MGIFLGTFRGDGKKVLRGMGREDPWRLRLLGGV